MCQVKYVICPDTNEQVNPGSKIWLPNVRSILKPYCEHCRYALGQHGRGNSSHHALLCPCTEMSMAHDFVFSRTDYERLGKASW